ncbi:MAG TPA: T9SS type A sorting domain-containing protein [Rubricoccaceae bacterium]|nr:T9SS type A sorting domain-containing protein [Rubricoccaceae bacterium]
MKGIYAILTLGAILTAAAVLPRVAQAQALFCFTDNAGFLWNLTLDLSTDTFNGAANVADPDGLWFVMGGRGTNGRTRRATVLTAVNGEIANDPSCGDGEGFVDFFTYNGLVSPAGGGTYSYNGDWFNSCGGEGTFTGTIAPGVCFAPRLTEPPADNPATMIAPSSEAGLRTSPEGYGVSSHPNPSDAGVTISYEIPEAQHVRVAVYDLLGRELAVLVDEPQEAGTHTVRWEAASMPSGTYLYRVTAGADAVTKQLVLVR